MIILAWILLILVLIEFLVFLVWLINGHGFQYLYNRLNLFSQQISVYFGGHPDISISERVGNVLYKSEISNRKKRFFKVIEAIIDALIFWEDNHVRSTVEIEGEINSKEIWDWSK